MHTMYVDKPMQGHGLMQAIARVNRVFRDKPAGLIVDYIGIAQCLKSALQRYSLNDQANTGVDEAQAIAVMMEKYEIVRDMYHGFDYASALGGTPQERLAMMAGAIEWILDLQQKLAAQDPLKFEKDKIKGAIRTDFILSAEIVAITLGIVAEAPLLNQVLVLSGIALVVTVGVYGLVGVIVKIDDLGYWLAEKSSALMQALGKGLLIIAPWLMKALSIVGTLAMFLVGGGIVVHGIAPLHHAIEHFAGQQSAVVAMILPTVLNLILGFIIGGIVVLGVKAVEKMRGQAH